ncbi:MAG: hypothetical protein IJU66_08410 [Oscillospiraceae bacterium]|nr:hypothetical protein [Oscillospiraceae bacterium]
MLVSLDQASRLIKEGRILHIAADDSLLARLPAGKWIGGTTPYFIAEDGGVLTKDKLFVSELDFAEDVKVGVYGKYNIFQIVEECFDNGLTMLILPFGSEVAAKYAKEAPDVEELLLHPTLGWVSGFDLDAGGEAKVYDGTTGKSYTDKAVAMYLKLPEGKTAMINIVNIFEDDKTDPVITFPENTLDVTRCRVNGQEVNFAEYIQKKNIDTQMPLVADYNGVFINTSIKDIVDGSVSLYAPVFRGIDYRFATRVANYADEFKSRIAATGAGKPFFSCNCILNYLYGNLEGKKTPPYAGPVTFGEVAYQLLNQTLVYCEIV